MYYFSYAISTQTLSIVKYFVSKPLYFFFFFLMIRRPPRSTLFPLHDALPISDVVALGGERNRCERAHHRHARGVARSEEHTSELQSHVNLVCRLLLEKKKKKKKQTK